MGLGRRSVRVERRGQRWMRQGATGGAFPIFCFLSRRLTCCASPMGEATGPLAFGIRAGLRALSWLYLAGVGASVLAHRSGLLRCERAPCPVISVGNLTVGGTGKSTATAEFARWLPEAGLRPAVLSRGYGCRAARRCASSRMAKRLAGPGGGGDEPVMLAHHLAGSSRAHRSAQAAHRARGRRALPADACLLDDGFQVWNLRRGSGSRPPG